MERLSLSEFSAVAWKSFNGRSIIDFPIEYFALRPSYPSADPQIPTREVRAVARFDFGAVGHEFQPGPKALAKENPALSVVYVFFILYLNILYRQRLA